MVQLSTLLLQIGVILLVARSVGWLFKKIHQPQVMGEMAAGIFLGPSLLGWLAPELSKVIFPVESLEILSGLSQVGLLLFMFLVGLELDLKILKRKSKTALVVSQASILTPFLLGMLLALFLYQRYNSGQVSKLGFLLFTGTSLSITAFPVLARILVERKMLNSHLGSVAIASAALNDVTGWIILAGVVFLVRAQDRIDSILLMLVGVLVFSSLMLFGMRRVLKRLKKSFVSQGLITHTILAGILLFLLASSWVTESLGIHALFGAFLAGAVMPKHSGFVTALSEKIHDIVTVLFLPLFFALTGLRTSIGLLNSVESWLICGLIIAVAIAGKFGGSALAARFSGLSWREAGALGALMNTRGLIELVLLNIGLDIGVISPTLFAMLVLMALVTTMMTAPLLEWIYFGRLFPGRYSVPQTTSDSLESDRVHPVSLE